MNPITDSIGSGQIRNIETIVNPPPSNKRPWPSIMKIHSVTHFSPSPIHDGLLKWSGPLFWGRQVGLVRNVVIVVRSIRKIHA